jgi:hypothetical protein
MVYNRIIGVWTCPSSGILNTRKHGVSETGYVCLSTGERRKTPLPLGPLERTNLNHSTSDPFSEILCFPVFGIQNDEQSPEPR